MDKKFVSYEVNCKIQFTKIICAEIRLIFRKKYVTHAKFLYLRKLYIDTRSWFVTMPFRMESGY